VCVEVNGKPQQQKRGQQLIDACLAFLDFKIGIGALLIIVCIATFSACPVLSFLSCCLTCLTCSEIAFHSSDAAAAAANEKGFRSNLPLHSFQAPSIPGHATVRKIA